MKSIHRNPETAGIGLRLAHLAEMVATRSSVAWLESHPENFLSNPHAAELLSELSAHYAISLHTVGISVGRLSIHRRNYQKSLTEALLVKFPATAWLMGSAFVRQAAERFVCERPPTAPCIAEYGAEFLARQ